MKQTKLTLKDLEIARVKCHIFIRTKFTCDHQLLAKLFLEITENLPFWYTLRANFGSFDFYGSSPVKKYYDTVQLWYHQHAEEIGGNGFLDFKEGWKPNRVSYKTFMKSLDDFKEVLHKVSN